MFAAVPVLTLWQTLALAHELDGRALFKRASSTCNDGTSRTPNGLSFSMDCSSNIPGSDFENPTSRTASDVYDCMRQCSVARPRCYGVSFNVPNGLCYLKTQGIVGAAVLSDTSTHSALVTPVSQLNVSNNACQYGDRTTQKTDNGMTFEIRCGLDVRGEDYCPTSATSCPWHASSLSECIDLCSTSHPLCTGVSYNPDMIQGYANCYPKSNFAVDGFVSGQAFVVHSAVATITNGTSNCTSNSGITAHNKKFSLNCNQNRAGNDISVYHELNLDRCAENCATYTGSGGSCVGVVFDASMTLGWENCYLKNATGTPLYNSSATFALLSGVKDTDGSSSSSSSSGGGSGSKAWIAGPVIGGIVAVVLIVALVACLRRRRKKARSAGRGIVYGGSQGEAHEARPKYLGGEQYARAPEDPKPVSADTALLPPVELDDTQRLEMSGRR